MKCKTRQKILKRLETADTQFFMFKILFSFNRFIDMGCLNEALYSQDYFMNAREIFNAAFLELGYSADNFKDEQSLLKCFESFKSANASAEKVIRAMF